MKNNYKLFVLIISLICMSCLDKHNQQNLAPFISEYKSFLEEYPNNKKHPNIYLLNIKKIVFPKKTIFVYKCKQYSRIDSLIIFKDSIKMNNEKLYLINENFISYNGKQLNVKKYQYLDRSSNLFIIDSLGLIVQHGQTHPYGTVIRIYAPNSYRNFGKKIIEDSLFFKFEFDFKHIDEYLKLRK